MCVYFTAQSDKDDCNEDDKDSDDNDNKDHCRIVNKVGVDEKRTRKIRRERW